MKSQYFSFILVGYVILFSGLFFLLGRVSLLFEDKQKVFNIQGVELASPQALDEFLEKLENFDDIKEDTPNELEKVEEVDAIESKAIGMFVASKQGKYYYPIDSKEGMKLSDKTKLYFETEEEAKGAGYVKKGSE